MVRRMLKDNKVPGTSTGTRAAEAPGQGAGPDTGFLGENQAVLCEPPGACLERGGEGLEWEEFLGKKKEKMEALSGQLENSPQRPWLLVSLPPQPLDCELGISSPSTHLKPRWHTPRSADWVPTAETPGGRAP